MSQIPSVGSGVVEQVIQAEEKNLGGFTVRRALPAAERRMVGPFVFFDHFGPVGFPPGEGVDVRPHPHIGISTVTWLVEGEITHRDSLGSHLPVRPGAVGLMTSGRGIVPSERSSPEDKARGVKLHGIQLWLALPAGLQETAPAFAHYEPDAIPLAASSNPQIKVIIGEAYGVRSPVAFPSPTLYGELLFDEAGETALPEGYEERALYLMEGQLALDGVELSSGDMAVVRSGAEASLEAPGPARAMLLGGAPYPEARTLWWNFVSTSKERIEQAKSDWKDGRFDPVPGETEFIPLPD